jgi:hypothetical protein
MSTDLDDLRLLRTFGDGCSKAFVIRAVMQPSYLLAMAPITFFRFNALG